MQSDDALGAMSSPPKRKTRRGRRRRGNAGKPHDHHKAIGDALAKGDHSAAHKAAFALIRSLGHKPMDADVTPDAPTTSPAPVARPTPSNASRLVAALKRKAV